jgi:hypothetical protein
MLRGGYDYDIIMLLEYHRKRAGGVRNSRPDNHIKGTPEHTMGMDLMICLGKKSNPTQEVPYETIIRGFRSAWQQQFDGNY